MPFPFRFRNLELPAKQLCPIPCYASRSACEVPSLTQEMIWLQADKTWRTSDILAP
jgi:hypothetical protein